jgi:hypothetical protein
VRARLLGKGTPPNGGPQNHPLPIQPISLPTPANRKPPGLATGGLLGVTEVAGSVYLQIIPCPQGVGALAGMKKPRGAGAGGVFRRELDRL